MHNKDDLTQYEAAAAKRRKTAAVLIFILAPLTIGAGTFWLGTSKYMIVSFLILIYSMLPFFMVFERRRPKAREVVLLAMMTAITVVAQMIFHVTVPIQAGTALVIVCGIAMGPEAGFFVGALARFICNFYMGQGPWTPWEMFCWGMLGFLAGLVFAQVDLQEIKEQAEGRIKASRVLIGPAMCILFAMIAAYITFLLWPGNDTTFWGWRFYVFGGVGLLCGVAVQRKRLPINSITLSAFTFVSVVVLYGGIMNICAMITGLGVSGGNPVSVDTLKLLLISGLPYDAMHGLMATLCVFVFGEAIIKKVERVKIKYGIYR